MEAYFALAELTAFVELLCISVFSRILSFNSSYFIIPKLWSLFSEPRMITLFHFDYLSLCADIWRKCSQKTKKCRCENRAHSIYCFSFIDHGPQIFHALIFLQCFHCFIHFYYMYFSQMLLCFCEQASQV